MHQSRQGIVKLSAKYGCFTRHPFQMTHTTYDVPTISALEGILQSYCWVADHASGEHASYVIDEIHVRKPVRKRGYAFNGINRKVWKTPLTINGSENNTENYYTFLVQPEYIIKFHVRSATRAVAQAQFIRCMKQIRNGRPRNSVRFGTKATVDHVQALRSMPAPVDMPDITVYGWVVQKVHDPIKRGDTYWITKPVTVFRGGIWKREESDAV